MEEFDVAVIGGGVVGAAAAYQLTHSRLRIALLEKESDLAFGVSKANSGIVHGGFHYSAATTLKGKLELAGNRLYDQWSAELGFPFIRCGIMVVAFTPEQLPAVRELYQRGVDNGVPGIEWCDAARTHQLEPKLAASACGALYAPQGGVVEPYAMVFALGEAAELNGCAVKRQFKVVSAKREGEFWKLTAADGREIRARYAVNAAGLYADEVSRLFNAEQFTISPRKGEEYLLDRLSAARPSKVIFPVPTAHTKGVLVIPTAGGTTMIGPTAHIVPDKTDTATTETDRAAIFALAKTMVSGVSERDLITSFSGSRPVIEGKEDFFIARSEKVPHLIQAAGIQSPGLTSAPAIAQLIADLLKQDGLDLQAKEAYRLPPKTPHVREVSAEKADALHKDDPAWTNVICRCEKVSEAEIRLAVRAGHTTLDGIKLATRAGMGRCQGGFCTLKIMHIISEESGIPLEEIIKRETGGALSAGLLGERKAR